MATKRKRNPLTLADMVLLSLLAERPRHGYDANQELERRQVRDWAGISRPQIYYSLQKLAAAGLLRVARGPGAACGPERHVYATTEAGRRALAEGLERPEWSERRERPPFLAWLALSWQARPEVFQRQCARREAYLRAELARAEATLAAVIAEVRTADHEAAWMIRLMLAQMQTELAWLRELRGSRLSRGGQ